MNNNILNNRYIIKKVLGQGGMGKVYLAFDLVTEEHIALKECFVSISSSSALVERIRREYYYMNKIKHPNIVYAIDFFPVGQSYCIAMEYINGVDIKNFICNYKYSVSIEKQISIAIQICDAVSTLNENGIIHRDIKPANIMLCGENLQPKLLDLGIAKAINNEVSTLTKTGSIVGTPEYISPEQVEGKTLANTDVFLLGILFHQFFSWADNSPFDGGSVISSMDKVCNFSPPPVFTSESPIHQQITTIVENALQKKSINRTETVKKLSQDFQKCTDLGKYANKPAILIRENSITQQKKRQSSILKKNGTLNNQKQILKLRNVFILLFVIFMLLNIIWYIYSEIQVDKAKNALNKSLAEANRLFAEKKYEEAIELYQQIAEKFNFKKAKEKIVEISKLLEQKKSIVTPENFVSRINKETGIFGDILRKYWLKEEMCFDFSHDDWKKLSITEQIKYAGEYQRWYAKTRNVEPEKAIEVNNAVFDMVLIPPGKFWMGSLSEETSRDPNEIRRLVWISQAFWLGKTEMTQEQWGQVVAPLGKENSVIQKKNYPVTNISWNDFNNIFPKASNGIKLQLPTEAEWEYACRGGTTTQFYWGDTTDRNRVNSMSYWLGYDFKNYFSNANEAIDKYLELLEKNNIPINTSELSSIAQEKRVDYLIKLLEANNIGITPVMHFQDKNNKNPFGLYDILGNVWELCRDGYEQNLQNITAKDPYQTPESSSLVVVRGGNWFAGFQICRCAFRTGFRPWISDASVGFRISSPFESSKN